MILDEYDVKKKTFFENYDIDQCSLTHNTCYFLLPHAALKYEIMSFAHGNLWLIEKIYNWFRISPQTFVLFTIVFFLKEGNKIHFSLAYLRMWNTNNIDLKCIGYSKIIWEIIFIILSIFPSKRLICLVWQKRPLVTSTILSVLQWYTCLFLPLQT